MSLLYQDRHCYHCSGRERNK